MSESLLIAVIGLGGAIAGALLTAFIQPLVTAGIQKTSRITVKIRNFRFATPKFLSDQIQEYLYNYQLKIRPNRQTRENFLSIGWANGLSVLEIKNQSTTSVDGVVVHTEDNRDIIADVKIDGEDRPTFFGKVCPVGTLRAGASCKLQIWTISDFSDNWWGERSDFVVSAREYGKIKMHYPLPERITKKYFLLRRGLFWAAFWILLFSLEVFAVFSRH